MSGIEVTDSRMDYVMAEIDEMGLDGMYDVYKELEGRINRRRVSDAVNFVKKLLSSNGFGGVVNNTANICAPGAEIRTVNRVDRQGYVQVELTLTDGVDPSVVAAQLYPIMQAQLPVVPNHTISYDIEPPAVLIEAATGSQLVVRVPVPLLLELSKQ